MQAQFRRSLSIAAALVLGGCQRSPPHPPDPPPAQVTVARPAEYPVQSYYEYNGYLDAVESVQIKARVKGLLTEVHFTEGVEVKRGDRLYTIDPREYTATVKKSEADKLKAAAELKRAKLDDARSKQLVSSRSIGIEEYQQKSAALETADAVLKQTEALLESAQLELSYTDIRAPIDGRISRTLVTRGNLVGQNEATLLTTIVSVDPLYIYFDAPERDLIEYQRDLQDRAMPSPTSRRIKVEIGVAIEEGFPHEGVIDFRENRVDTGTGTVRVRGRIANPQLPPNAARLLYPGLYSRVRVPAGAAQPKLVLPEDALMTGQEGRYVYVVTAANIVEKRTLIVGAQVWKGEAPLPGKAPVWALTAATPTASPDKSASPAASAAIPIFSVIAIEKGLEAGDRVIVTGLQKARAGSPVAPEEKELIGPPAPKPGARS